MSADGKIIHLGSGLKIETRNWKFETRKKEPDISAYHALAGVPVADRDAKNADTENSR